MKTLAAFVIGAALLGQTHDLPRSAGAAPSTAALRFDVPRDHPERWSIVLTGVDARAPRTDALAVYAVPARDDSTAGLPPMTGRVEMETAGTSVRFVPAFAPAAGVTYVARAGALEARFTWPDASRAAMTPTTSVTEIYPTSDRVPANLLKLYIEFSAPMSDGEAERRIHLLDAQGREVPRAFLHVDDELWDASRRRLTVLFDPGRVKRGLRANLEDGAPLVAGRTYRLVVDAGWRDGEGRPLVSRVVKTLVVGAADRTSPDWHRWRVNTPIAATTTPLVVRFDEPLDRALLDRVMVVADAKGHRIDGTIAVGSNEASWSFTPARPWSTGPHRLLVDPRLEDRAANSLRSLFDVDLTAPRSATHASADTDTGAITLSFVPASGT